MNYFVFDKQKKIAFESALEGSNRWKHKHTHTDKYIHVYR